MARGLAPVRSVFTPAKLERSIRKVQAWVEQHQFKGYDPADGNSPYLHALTFGQVFPQRVLQQLVLRAPFNVRPLIGIRPEESTKGRGYMAAGYLRLYQLTGDAEYRDRALSCLDWLMQNSAPNYHAYCWGDHFNYATRTGKRPRFEPIIVWSSLIGQVFLDAYEAFGDPAHLLVVKSVCEWILKLPREETATGACLSYVAFKQNSIHNANLLGAALLARAGDLIGDADALPTARSAMEYSCARQNSDGSWYYGESPMHRWIDNFHTAYNLDCIKHYIDSTGDATYQECLQRGLKFFKAQFFLSDGRPKYYHDRVFPIDIQSSSQAIDTLSLFAPSDEESLALAMKVALWTIDNMQDPDGHFYYRDLGWVKVKTPMIHWGQATMFKALTHLLARVKAL